MLERFITFEGGEGSGKTSILNRLSEELNKEYSIFLTREPGGSKISEDIRKIILDKKNIEMDKHTEALLYAASRVQHLTKVVIPRHNSTKDIILCDRYLDSSIAYQGYARKLGVEYILNINNFALKYLPGLTIYIKIDPKKALDRLIKKQRDMDRLDLENIEFHEEVYKGYNDLVLLYKDRIKVVNGEQDFESVYNDCKKIIIDYINKL